MITLNGVTSSSDLAFTRDELIEESKRWGFRVKKNAQKQDLVEVLGDEEGVLYHRDYVVLTYRNGISINELESGNEITRKDFNFQPTLIGVTPSGEIGVLNWTGEKLTVMDRKLTTLWSVDLGAMTGRGNGWHDLSGFNFVFLGRDNILGVLNLKTRQIKNLGKSAHFNLRISVRGNHILVSRKTDTVTARGGDQIELWNIEKGELVFKTNSDKSFFSTLLIDSNHFAVIEADENIGRLYTIKNGKANTETLGSDIHGLGLSNGRLLILDKHFIHVEAITEKDTTVNLTRIFFSPGDSRITQILELRDSRILCKVGEDAYFVVDINRERVSAFVEEVAFAVGYFPPDPEESREFRELIGSSVPKNVPIEIADVIEKFI